MAWQFVGVSAAATVTGTPITLTEPAGVADGDLLIACIASRTTSLTSIVNTGWTLVNEQKTNNILTTTSAVASGVMLYRIRSGVPDLTFTLPASGTSVCFGRMVAYRGNTAAPVDTSTAVTTAVNTTAVSVAGLTTTAGGELIVAMACGGQEATWSAFAATDPATASGATDTSTTPTAGTWLERADSSTTTGADASLAIFDAIKATAGATGNLTATASLGAGHVIIAAAFKAASLSAGVGGYTYSGTDASLEHGWELVPEAASYSYSGTAATLTIAPFLVGYVFSGDDATLTHEVGVKTLPAESGSYSYSGTDASLEHGWEIAVEAASYSFAGQEITGDRTWRLIVEAGSFSFTGTDATLTYVAGELVLSAEAGSYAISGTAASPERGYVLVAETFISAGGSPIGLLLTLTGGGGSTYSFSGSPVDLTITTAAETVLGAAGGSFAFSGQQVTLDRTFRLIPEAGSYSFTGTAAELTYEPAGQTILGAAGGSFAFSGSDATLTVVHALELAAEAGAFSFTGSNAALTYTPAPPIAPATTWGGEGAEFWVRKWREQAQQLKPVVVKPFAEAVNEQAPAQHVIPVRDDRRPDPEFTEFTDFIRLLEKL